MKNFKELKTITIQSLLIIAFMLLVLFCLGMGGYLLWTNMCEEVLFFSLGVVGIGFGCFFINFIRKELDKL